MDHTLIWHRDGRTPAPERRLTSHVSALNTGRDYDRFCTAIETLCTAMGPAWNPETTALTLMSHGGRPPGAWRDHIKSERLACFAD